MLFTINERMTMTIITNKTFATTMVLSGVMLTILSVYLPLAILMYTLVVSKFNIVMFLVGLLLSMFGSLLGVKITYVGILLEEKYENKE